MRRKKFHLYFCAFLSWIETLRDLRETYLRRLHFPRYWSLKCPNNFGTRYLYMATDDTGNSRREWERLGRRLTNLPRRRKHLRAESSLRCKPLTSSIYFPSNNHPFIFHEKKIRFDTSIFPIILLLLLLYTYIVAYIFTNVRNLKMSGKTNFRKSRYIKKILIIKINICISSSTNQISNILFLIHH